MVTATSGLVSPAWVAEHLGDPGLVLVEVDEETSSHHWAHVPGATYLDWQDCRRELLAARPGSTAAFERLMSVRGIRPEDDVVLYGDSANRFAAGVLWLMRQHGHRSLRLMDGGRTAWSAAGLPLTERETVREATQYRAAGADPSPRATRDDVLAHLAAPDPGAVILDCRTQREYAGRAAGPASDFGDLCVERGHMPGAVNLPAADLVTADGTLLPPDELERAFTGLGLRRDNCITAYCHTADRSCLVWFALHEVLGWPSVQVYDGGWLEYGHLLGAPVSGPRDEVDDQVEEQVTPAAVPPPAPAQQ